MSNVIQPFHLLVIALAGWLNRHQQEVIDYLMEENRVLKEQLEGQLCPAKIHAALASKPVWYKIRTNRTGQEVVVRRFTRLVTNSLCCARHPGLYSTLPA